jgi:hypothetical protein
MSSVSIDVDIEDVLWGMSDWEKQELVDDLYDDGYIAKKDPRNGVSVDSYWDEAVTKLVGNKWRLSKEDEETILAITNKIIQ